MSKAGKKKAAIAPLSKAQREIMEMIWEAGELSVSEVWETLSRRRGVARNTVQTMLVRMEEKGWIEHRTIGRTFLYRSAMPRQDSLGRIVQNLVDTLFAGSAEELVTALLHDRALSKEEAERIRAMIDQAEQKETNKPTKAGGKG